MKRNLTNQICTLLTFLLVAAIAFGYATRAEQQALVTTKVIVDEVDYDQAGPVMGALTEQFRDAYIKRLRSRGDIEFVSSPSADYQCRVMLNIIPVICGESEESIGGYAVTTLMVTRVKKDLVRLDQRMYTAPTVADLAKSAARATAQTLGLPETKEEKEDKAKGRPTVVASQELKF